MSQAAVHIESGQRSAVSDPLSRGWGFVLGALACSWHGCSGILASSSLRLLVSSSPHVTPAGRKPRFARPFVIRCAALLLLLTLSTNGPLYGQETRVDTAGVADALMMAERAGLDIERLPETAFTPLAMLNVRGADLRDLLRGIAHQHRLNLRVASNVDQQVTIRLQGLSAIEALLFLADEYGLALTQQGRVLRLDQPPPPPPPAPPEPTITITDSLLTIDVKDEPLERVIRALVEQSGRNIVVRQGVRGTITGLLNEVPLALGLQTLLQNNGLVLREKEGIWHIDRMGMATEAEGGGRRSFWVQATDSIISLDIVNAPIADVLREVAAQMETNLVTYAVPQGTLTAKVQGMTLEETFNFLLRGTDITYRYENGLYLIGNKQTSGIATTQLLRLHHLRADIILDLIPKHFHANLGLQVVKEHNGITATGTNDVIFELEQFIREVDLPTPQILIEALVVDFVTDNLMELGVSYGVNAAQAEAAHQEGYGFGGTNGFNDGYSVAGNGQDLQDHINWFADFLGYKKIGRLPSNFFFRLHALAREGVVKVRSRPQISALNGHTASIEIGTTQYYILRSATPVTGNNQVVVQETERFEQVEANVRLEVTPWVSAAGEVTAEIRPEFSTPLGDLNPEVPPTINSRILESTVRLQDGETIILGGLIQETRADTYNKVPLLGDIPWLGQLFRSRSHEDRKSELIVFLTPHVFYGDDRDNEKWQRLQQRLNLTASLPMQPVDVPSPAETARPAVEEER